MFDHVGIAVSDLAASERFYRTVLSVLGAEPSHADAELVEWDDWDIGPTDREHPVTRGLHVGFRARDRAQVDAFWQAGVDAGYRDDGAPGPRTQYTPTYYGGFLLDPDGNSVEAVHTDREDAVPDGRVDHLWLRVRDPQASRRFYTTIAPHAGLRLAHDEPGRVQLSGPDYSFSLVRDERPLTEHVHLAFPARRTPRCARSTPPRSRPATRTTARPASARSITRATTARSCSTRTGTTSRSSTTTGAEPWPTSPPTTSRLWANGRVKQTNTRLSRRAVPLQAIALEALDQLRPREDITVHGHELAMIDLHYGHLAVDSHQHAVSLMDALALTEALILQRLPRAF